MESSPASLPCSDCFDLDLQRLAGLFSVPLCYEPPLTYPSSYPHPPTSLQLTLSQTYHKIY